MSTTQRSIKRNTTLVIADAFGIMSAMMLDGQIPALLDGALLLFTETLGVLLLVDGVWLRFFQKRETRAKEKD